MRVDGVLFRVIGVIKAVPGGMDGTTAHMPYTAMRDLYSSVIWTFNVTPKPVMVGQAKSEVDRVLTARIGSPSQSFCWSGGTTEDFQVKASILIGLIGMLVLLSAGIGISNKAYVDVLERVDQIALWRALGCSRMRVYVTTVLESMLLCGVASAVGEGIGWALYDAAEAQTHAVMAIKLAAPLLPVAGIMVFTLLLGAIASLQAAAIAARANPAELLGRKEVV
jgi:ABC-type antimicrobial peptide transport system permease subunit